MEIIGGIIGGILTGLLEIMISFRNDNLRRPQQPVENDKA